MKWTVTVSVAVTRAFWQTRSSCLWTAWTVMLQVSFFSSLEYFHMLDGLSDIINCFPDDDDSQDMPDDEMQLYFNKLVPPVMQRGRVEGQEIPATVRLSSIRGNLHDLCCLISVVQPLLVHRDCWVLLMTCQVLQNQNTTDTSSLMITIRLEHGSSSSDCGSLEFPEWSFAVFFLRVVYMLASRGLPDARCSPCCYWDGFMSC